MTAGRSKSSILHLDLDAFFAAVEQRDKPSLRGRPVVVGGIGGRGVVSTASYEARAYGARSAMPMAQARRQCPPGTAFLSGRYEAYRQSSKAVMELLREHSPLLEQVSVDEAYLDISELIGDLAPEAVHQWAQDLLDGIAVATGGLTASVGIATSKMMAKIASEMNKPAGVCVVEPGTEWDVLHPLPVRAVAGVGPVTAGRLHTFGVETVGDLYRVSMEDLVAILGQAHGMSLHALARAQDDRPVVVEREAKSISVEETFAEDIADPQILDTELRRMTDRLAARLGKSAQFGRTITIKARLHDFTTLNRSDTLRYATGDAEIVLREARRLLNSLDTTSGLRLLGVGVAGLSAHAQDELVPVSQGPGPVPDLPDAISVLDESASDPAVALTSAANQAEVPSPVPGSRARSWVTGQDVRHTELGPGWVWGSGRSVVTVRFEGPRTRPGPIRSFSLDSPDLSPADPPDWRES